MREDTCVPAGCQPGPPDPFSLPDPVRYDHPANKDWLYGLQGGFCWGCTQPFPRSRLTIDHIFPRAKGGTDHLSNLQLLCGRCNRIKGTRSHAALVGDILARHAG